MADWEVIRDARQLSRSFYWLCAGLSVLSGLRVVGHCCTCNYCRAVCRNKDVDPGMKQCLVARRELRRALNEGTLRAFRNADRFTTFKIFRRPGALRRRVAPGPR